MNKRLFVFGCSYTNYNGSTWPDWLAPNFDQYRNFGQGGASNMFMLDKFMQADEEFKFGSQQDHVAIMLTGFDRFCWLAQDGYEWHTPGDLTHWSTSPDARKNYPWVRSFYDHMWSAKMAVAHTWLAARSMKQLLVDRSCPHTMLMALDNSHYITDSKLLGLGPQELKRAQEIYDLLDHKEPFDLFRARRGFRTNDHPTPEQHQAFAQEVFPDLYCSSGSAVRN